MWNFDNPHLRDRIKTLTEEEWDTIQSVALALIHQNPHMQIMMAEANALIAMINEKDLGVNSRLVH